MVVDADTGAGPLPLGEVGELVVRGPQVMAGYWNDPDATANALRDGWLFTGDLATCDADGFFRIVDRKKDLIITSGFNVYPTDVEHVLRQFEGVEDVAVLGVPDADRGELVKAVVVPKDGHEVQPPGVRRVRPPAPGGPQAPAGGGSRPRSAPPQPARQAAAPGAPRPAPDGDRPLERQDDDTPKPRGDPWRKRVPRLACHPLAVRGRRADPVRQGVRRTGRTFRPTSSAASRSRRVLPRAGVRPADVGEVVFGNVAGQADASNVARVIALRSGIPQDRVAHTVNRNCASGMESIFSAWQILAEGRTDLIVAGGTESMSNVPLLWNRRARDFFLDMVAGGLLEAARARLRPRPAEPLQAGGRARTGPDRPHLRAEHGADGRGAGEGVRHQPRGAGPVRPDEPPAGGRRVEARVLRRRGRSRPGGRDRRRGREPRTPGRGRTSRSKRSPS